MTPLDDQPTRRLDPGAAPPGGPGRDHGREPDSVYMRRRWWPSAGRGRACCSLLIVVIASRGRRQRAQDRRRPTSACRRRPTTWATRTKTDTTEHGHDRHRHDAQATPATPTARPPAAAPPRQTPPQNGTGGGASTPTQPQQGGSGGGAVAPLRRSQKPVRAYSSGDGGRRARLTSAAAPLGLRALAPRRRRSAWSARRGRCTAQRRGQPRTQPLERQLAVARLAARVLRGGADDRARAGR